MTPPHPATVATSGSHAFIAALGVGQIVSWGTLYYSFPLLAGPLAAELGISRPEVYGLATVALVVAGLMAYPVGAAIDRGWGRWVMSLGALLGGLVLFGWGRADSLGVLYLLFAGLGLAQAMTLYDPAFAVVARRFGADARRGITSLTLWGGFASTVFVPLVQLLIEAVGWRDTLLVLGLMNGLLGAGLYALAIVPARDAPPPAAHAASHAGHSSGIVRQMLRHPVFWALLVAFTVFYGVFSALNYHLYPLLLERGLEPSLVVTVIALIGPAQVIGRILVWRLAGGRSIRRIGAVTVAVFPLAYLLLVLPPSFALLLVFAAVYGAANGVMTIVRGLAVPEMLTREAYGALNGLLAAPGMAAKAFAPILAALLWAAAGGYQALILTFLVASIIVAGTFWLAAATSTISEPEPTAGKLS